MGLQSGLISLLVDDEQLWTEEELCWMYQCFFLGLLVVIPFLYFSKVYVLHAGTKCAVILIL